MVEQHDLYMCFKCLTPYNCGEHGFDSQERERSDAKNFLCLRCAAEELGYG